MITTTINNIYLQIWTIYRLEAVFNIVFIPPHTGWIMLTNIINLAIFCSKRV